MRPFRFGVEASGPYARQSWRSLCREVASLGYSILAVVDHLGDQISPVPAMMAAADAAPELRVTSYVFANELRHPDLLARDMATIDRLTEGRVEVGIGAGWKRAEHRKLGLPFPPADERVARLAESLTIIKELLTRQAGTFEGSHYLVHESGDFPRTVQRPCPPVLVGGGGRQVLSLAAREADIVGLNPAHPPSGADVLADATAAATARKIAWIRESAGDRIDQLEVNVRVYHAEVTQAWRGAAERMAARSGLSVDDVLNSPHILIGDVARVAAEITRHRELYGISYLVVTTDAFRELAPVVARLAGK